MTAKPNAPVVITAVLTPEQALAFAQFAKRSGWDEFKANAIDDDEAYLMIDAANVLRESLARAGFAPR